MRHLIFAILCLTFFWTSGCQDEAPQSVQNESKPALTVVQETSPTAGQDQAEPPEQPEPPDQEQPRPPVFENFQGAPQLSLFPRVGDFRPSDESDRLPYWKTFIDHLVKTTGVAEDPSTSNRAWVFRSINSIDSVAYFSPLGVTPQTAYKVSFKITAELAEGASAGIGILEFNEFLWIPGQYTEETFNLHFRRTHEGKRLTGKIEGEHTFTFTTGPETRMIHLVLFRDGTHDRNSLIFDDIMVEQVGKL